jgi:YidC/Oxa1 family membrane protein insertase
MFYLGPYFNLLPVIAVALMIVQQKLFTPPPTDEQQEMQQSMMKYMMVFMGLMFYKIPAGLSLYFIASSLWGIIERKTIGKKPASGTPGDDPGALASRTSRDDDPKPNGGLFGRVAERWKELQAHAEGKRQFERKDPPHDRRKKKKKK